MFSLKGINRESKLHYAIFMACTFLLGHIPEVNHFLVQQLGIDATVVDYGLSFLGILIKAYVMPTPVLPPKL